MPMTIDFRVQVQQAKDFAAIVQAFRAAQKREPTPIELRKLLAGLRSTYPTVTAERDAGQILTGAALLALVTPFLAPPAASSPGPSPSSPRAIAHAALAARLKATTPP